jgi:hypothetical protein
MCRVAGDEASCIVSLLHDLNLLCEIKCPPYGAFTPHTPLYGALSVLLLAFLLFVISCLLNHRVGFFQTNHVSGWNVDLSILSKM